MASSRIIGEDLAAIAERAGDELDQLAGRPLVITGAGGMLARYLVETVAWCNRHRFAKPCSLMAVVRRLPRYPVEGPGVHYLVHDARRAPLGLAKEGYLILAATLGAPNRYLSEPLETLELNGPGLFSWLECAVRAHSRSVLYLSSGEVYGSPELDGPTPEDYAGRIDPVLERSVYAESKRYGEAVAMAFHRSRGLPVKIARPFQVFGPGIDPGDGRAMSSFLRAAAGGEPIRLDSAGAARRTFLYVADATVAFLKILVAGQPGRVYNVGSEGPEVSIAALAARISELSGTASGAVAAGSAVSDAPARTCPDTARLRRELGFEPRYGLDELIARTLEWLKEETVC